MSKMFPFITKTWNPLGGECQHNCSYCWAKKLTKQYGMKKYVGYPTINTKELHRVFEPNDFVFVCDMCDLFGDWVPTEYIQRIMDQIGFLSQGQFLLLTKNPGRYLKFDLPDNVVAGATIECDIMFKVKSEAPVPFLRIGDMRKVKAKKMVSIEPIMEFTESFPYSIASIKPDFVAVGYDNYHNNLPEPPLGKTMDLIAVLKDRGITVYEKTLREKNNGKHD
jgi:protein gp37